MQNNLLPLPEGLPTFQQALASLESVPSILYRGLEHAAYKTCTFRDDECPKELLDGGLSASLLRFHAIRYLQGKGIEALPDDPAWHFDHLSFMGIAFYYNQQHVRVLKGPQGSLLGCGISEKRKRFYNQLPSNYLMGNTPMRSQANLIVLWDFDPSYHLSKLRLALPAKGGRRPQDVSVYWCEVLSHPAETENITPPATPAGDDGLGGLIAPHPDTISAKETKGKG
jgi:hypothetical protein